MHNIMCDVENYPVMDFDQTLGRNMTMALCCALDAVERHDAMDEIVKKIYQRLNAPMRGTASKMAERSDPRVTAAAMAPA